MIMIKKQENDKEKEKKFENEQEREKKQENQQEKGINDRQIKK